MEGCMYFKKILYYICAKFQRITKIWQNGMSEKFKEHKQLNLSEVNKTILEKWQNDDVFAKSVSTREGCPAYVFYEGPPSANGLPGIHHVMARTIKDIFCRFKTMQGFQVHRKAGWDTHGLPVELGVEKSLGITKEDIGSKISVEEYNSACRSDVMKYTNVWKDLTNKMGYWVDMDNPYITYDNKYIETLWYLLKQMYQKNLLYKGYTIQPFSPAAGTGLSSHELNQPGCYRDVKDTTCAAQFKLIRNAASEFAFAGAHADVYVMAWTTTPWTLPSNTALCVGPNIKYVAVNTFNPYTYLPVTVILAKDRLNGYFSEKGADIALADYKAEDKIIPYSIVGEFTGTQLAGMKYEQLLPWVKPEGRAFEVICGDFVTTEDGTGVVHIAPTFGADDYRVANLTGISPLTILDLAGTVCPLVDKQGRFFPIEKIDPQFVAQFVNVDLYSEYAGKYVKNAYDETLTEKDPSIDVHISIQLKTNNLAFKVEKHSHSYPHCWRTDKPVLYYPLDSWFIRTTAAKDKLIDLNKTINWKPESTGTGRFGKWLENLQDWNLSRSRYWGTPLPIWVSEDKSEQICIGSVAELKAEVEKSVAAGFMQDNPFADFDPTDFSAENYNLFDLHRPYCDNIVLVSPTGNKMMRELDLIDVWFDSGAMPYAQLHYPFENKELFEKVYPADFIAEGVDQTRGWFFTLHAIAALLFDSVAFKNVVSNGLVLAKDGSKMSKRLNNAIDPFESIEKYGSDPLRWYMVTNASPWDNLKFDIEGVEEVRRKFFGTLYNTYQFFALYANVDKFCYAEAEVPMAERSELDRWVISLLNTLILDVADSLEKYEPTRAGRAIQDFVNDNLSNWYVRLSRKRFWGTEMTQDKLSAYQTLATCLETVSRLMAPIAPFYADQLFSDLQSVMKKDSAQSVHLAYFPKADETLINTDLEQKMDIAQKICSMVLALRRKVTIKVRLPLNKILVPVLTETARQNVQAVADIIRAEVNVKTVECLDDASGILVKRIKPNFKSLGPKYSTLMKQIAAVVVQMTTEQISSFERNGSFPIDVAGELVMLTLEDVEIISEDIPGWLVANEGALTVALDITVTPELRLEGIAREFVNRIQNYRKEIGLEVTDKIDLQIQTNSQLDAGIETHKEYIQRETQCTSIAIVAKLEQTLAKDVEIEDGVNTLIYIQKT